MPDFKDGYQTLTTFALDSDVQLWQKTVKPIGLSGGGAIDTTTMSNNNVRTKYPKSLYDITDSNMSCAWNALFYDEAIAMINQNQLITTTFPDTSTVAWWGWLDTFEPDDMEEGEHPTAQVGLIASNVHETTKAETLPVYTAAA